MEIKLKIPLKELILTACNGTYTNRHLQELYRLFYTIAHQLVRRKMINGKFPIDRLGLSEGDITHDCISELFKLGNDNELTELCKYFNYQRISIESENEEMLFIQIRRLVFTIVNDRIFQLYNEADPAFGKILRNIKIAIGNQNQLRLVNKFDEQYLEVTSCDKLTCCKTMDDDFLFNEVYEIMTKENEIPNILRQLLFTLAHQDIYQRHVRLTSLAIAIKNGYEQLNISEITDVTIIDDKMLNNHPEQIIKEICFEVNNEMKPNYVNKKKVDTETFDSYMKAIEQLLLIEFIECKDGIPSYYEHLKTLIPNLTKNEYLKNHRTIIEYLGKITKKRVRAKLKEILSNG